MKAVRHQAILQLIRETGSQSTENLASHLRVSKETIRRDLQELQTQGQLIRRHGWAKIVKRETQDSGDSFRARQKSHQSRKADIARQALSWIDEGMVIALDASSTCWSLARQLPDIGITVFTNSARVCRELSRRQNIQLISSGGRLLRKYDCYVNPALFSQLKTLEIDLFLFSCEAVDAAGAIWDSNDSNAEYKIALLRRAAQSLLLLDKSKLNRTSEVQIGHLDDVTQVISDLSEGERESEKP